MSTRTRYHKSHARMHDRILLALRPGSATGDALTERLGGAHTSALSDLVRTGLVERDDRLDISYRLTPAGRAACPRWRDICRGS